MFIYEKEWANQRSRFLSYTVENLSWHLHFHAAFEICLVLKGVVEITIDNRLYTINYQKKIPADNTIRGLFEYESLFDANNTFLQKGLLYAVLGRLVSNTDFKETQADEDAVLLKSHKLSPR